MCMRRVSCNVHRSRLLLIPPDSRHRYCAVAQRAALFPSLLPLIGKQALCRSSQQPPALCQPEGEKKTTQSLRPLLVASGSTRDIVLGCRLQKCQRMQQQKGVFVSWQRYVVMQLVPVGQLPFVSSDCVHGLSSATVLNMRPIHKLSQTHTHSCKTHC